jgi:hypothetical protein
VRTGLALSIRRGRFSWLSALALILILFMRVTARTSGALSLARLATIAFRSLSRAHPSVRWHSFHSSVLARTSGRATQSLEAEKTAMGVKGGTGCHGRCMDVPCVAKLAVCSFGHMKAVGHQGPPLPTQGPRPAILKYQGSYPTQQYPTIVGRQIAFSTALRLRGHYDVIRSLRTNG